MPDQFDRYRESQVLETDTVWPEEFNDWDAARRAALEDKLHAAPDAVAHLEYIRTATGFCRRITVTPEDVARLG